VETKKTIPSYSYYYYCIIMCIIIIIIIMCIINIIIIIMCSIITIILFVTLYPGRPIFNTRFLTTSVAVVCRGRGAAFLASIDARRPAQRGGECSSGQGRKYIMSCGSHTVSDRCIGR
jgi:hypothetical protein